MYNLVINQRNKENNIFWQNDGFSKKEIFIGEKHLWLITKKYILEACVKSWDWSVQPFSRNLGHRL